MKEINTSSTTESTENYEAHAHLKTTKEGLIKGVSEHGCQKVMDENIKMRKFVHKYKFGIP